MLELKGSPNVHRKVALIVGTVVVTKNDPIRNFDRQICYQELSKIAQTGYTGSEQHCWSSFAASVVNLINPL